MEATKETWAIVELMGHVRLAGRLSEEERFGSKMGRLDIPVPPKPDCLACKGTGRVGEGEDIHDCRMPDCNGFLTQFFGGGSVYRITFVTEAVARHVSKASSAAPVSPWDLPKVAITHQPSNQDEAWEPDFSEDDIEDSMLDR